jgi:signal transduction histidine kinase
MAHLPPGCQIHIQVRTRENFAELTIEDNGPGFPAELKNRVFQRFVKGSQSTGHGLGLAFVDAVIQAHGGKVHVVDRGGGGAALFLTLPLAPVTVS